LEISLPPSDTPVLVSWASRSAGDVTLELPDRWPGSPESAGTTGFDDFTRFGPGEPITVTLSASAVGEDTALALAVYRLTGPPAPGFTKDGITFRQTVGSDRLAGAVVGDEGQAELRVSFPSSAAGFAYSTFCEGLPRGYWVHPAFDGVPGQMSSGGCGGPAFDPAGAGSFTPHGSELATVGSRMTARVWATPAKDATVRLDELSSGRLGLGVYSLARDRLTVLGMSTDRVQEADGHRWIYVTALPSRRSRPIDTRLPGAGPYLIVWVLRTPPSTSGTVDEVLHFDGRRTSMVAGFGGGGTSAESVQVPRGTRRLQAETAGAPGTRFTLLLYERVD
jgi:hypothetical protein